MRPLRSAVLLFSTLAVIGCQTAGSIARPAAVPSAANASSSGLTARAETRPAVATREYTQAPAAEPGRRRTVVLVVVILAAAIIAAVLLSGGDGIGSGY